MAYLDTHRPKQKQFGPRRGHQPYAIVVHTSEGNLSAQAAENTAKFIQGRSNYGSYHEVVDTNSHVHLVEYANRAYHVGTKRMDGVGWNYLTLGLSFACKTSDWKKMSPATRRAILSNGAARATVMIQWVKNTYGIAIPAQRVTRSQLDKGARGLISHAELDPTRRSDPGQFFPWTEFLNNIKGGAEPTMSKYDQPNDMSRATQLALSEAAKRVGLNPVAADGFIGDKTVLLAREINEVVQSLAAKVEELDGRPTASPQAIQLENLIRSIATS